MALKFVDELPPQSNGPGKWDETIAELQARPGEWAEIDRTPLLPGAKHNSPGRSALYKRGAVTTQRSVIDDNGERVLIFYAMWPDK